MNGQFGLNVSSLSWEQSELPIVEGRVDLIGLAMTRPLALDLGHYAVDLTKTDTPGETLLAAFDTVEANMPARGTVNLQKDGQYQMRGLLTSDRNIPSNLRGSLDFIAPRDDDGNRILELEGQLSLPF
ncbi:MAG: type II secretion system protein GspN [Gammaproteobacteria bacterium]|nr:type II secretion system protein GspN [Gammaproteobacteria bacterium]